MKKSFFDFFTFGCLAWRPYRLYNGVPVGLILNLFALVARPIESVGMIGVHVFNATTTGFVSRKVASADFRSFGIQRPLCGYEFGWMIEIHRLTFRDPLPWS